MHFYNAPAPAFHPGLQPEGLPAQLGLRKAIKDWSSYKPASKADKGRDSADRFSSLNDRLDLLSSTAEELGKEEVKNYVNFCRRNSLYIWGERERNNAKI